MDVSNKSPKRPDVVMCEDNKTKQNKKMVTIAANTNTILGFMTDQLFI